MKPETLNVQFATNDVKIDVDQFTTNDNMNYGACSSNEYTRMQQLVSELKLCQTRKNFISCRMIEETKHFENKRDKISLYFASLNMLNIIGSVAMPALLTLSSESMSNAMHKPVFWLTFSLSIATGLSTATLSMFQLTRRFFMYSKTLELVKQNFFSFVSLSGKYCKFLTHAVAYTRFCARHENLLSLVAKKEYTHKQNADGPPQTPSSQRSIVDKKW